MVSETRSPNTLVIITLVGRSSVCRARARASGCSNDGGERTKYGRAVRVEEKKKRLHTLPSAAAAHSACPAAATAMLRVRGRSARAVRGGSCAARGGARLAVRRADGEVAVGGAVHVVECAGDQELHRRDRHAARPGGGRAVSDLDPTLPCASGRAPRRPRRRAARALHGALAPAERAAARRILLDWGPVTCWAAPDWRAAGAGRTACW